MGKTSEKQIFMKDLIWKVLHGPIPAGYKVSHKNGDLLDNRGHNLHLVPAHLYPGNKGQVYTTKSC